MTELSDYQQEILNDTRSDAILAMNVNADRLIVDCWTLGMSLDETQNYVLNGSGLLVDQCVILEEFDGLDAEYILLNPFNKEELC